jgi:hypothetical protein
MARGRDGRWTALDAKHIYEHAKAGGSVYQAHLRQAVRERLPWASWAPVRNGMAELEQLPAEVLEEFSTRRRRILERQRELVEAGVAVGDLGRERIAYDTREAKHEVDEADWRIGIRARAAEHGLGQDELDGLSMLAVAPEAEPVSWPALWQELFSARGLTARANTFRERDVVIAVAAAHGQGANAGEVVGLAQRLLERPEVVVIPNRTDRLYTTTELLEAERRIVAHAVEGRGCGVGVVGEVDVCTTLPRLSALLSVEQEQVVVAIAGSGNRIDTVEALAGTGKTTSAAALRSVYEDAGYRVVGAAPTGRAVRELKEQAGIEEARTLDGWAAKLDGDPDAFRSATATVQGARCVSTVLIIDEAGMAHTRLTARVLDAAVKADVKVIAFGDSGQLSSVQAGGWLGALTRHVGSHELREVMRQRDPQERRGLARVHGGDPASYVEMKAARGELTVFDGERPGVDAEAAAIERWAAAREIHGPDQAVIVCRDNHRRDRLNGLARIHLQQRGELGESVEVAGREWAVGDRVIARRNERQLDVDNGTRGTITAVHQTEGLEIRTDTGGRRHLDVEYAARNLQHAYALTGHGMQGATVHWAAVVGQPGDFSRNWSYTALSRAREPTEILLVDEPSRVHEERVEIAPAPDTQHQGPLERMAARMRERDDEDLALEQLEHAGATSQEHERDEPPGEASARLVRIGELGSEIDLVNAELKDLPTDDVKFHRQIEDSIASARAAQARLSVQWRNRRERKLHAQHLERQLASLSQEREQLLQRTPDPDEVRERAAALIGRRNTLSAEHSALHDQAVAAELDRNPEWLLETLGPRPESRQDRERWHRTAREIASHRIRQGITDPTDTGARSRDIALNRSITDTRVHLGLDLPTLGHDRGLDFE